MDVNTKRFFDTVSPVNGKKIIVDIYCINNYVYKNVTILGWDNIGITVSKNTYGKYHPWIAFTSICAIHPHDVVENYSQSDSPQSILGTISVSSELAEMLG